LTHLTLNPACGTVSMAKREDKEWLVIKVTRGLSWLLLGNEGGNLGIQRDERTTGVTVHTESWIYIQMDGNCNERKSQDR